MTAFLCLHCNYKEYRQEAEKPAALVSSSTSSTSTLSTLNSSQSNVLKSPSQNNVDSTSTTSTASATVTASQDASDPHSMLAVEEKQLQAHMSSAHQIDFAQIVAQHQQLSSGSTTAVTAGSGGASTTPGDGVVLIESPPMNDMYLQVSIKSLKYIDDELLRRDEFKADLFYSCPICLGDVSVHVANGPGQLASAFSQHESVTFDYLMAHFWHYHQFKAVPLFVCTLCNCARVSLIDCVYHYIRSHFNAKPVIGICAYNIYDKLGPTGSAQATGMGSTASSLATGGSGSQSSKKSSSGSSASSQAAAAAAAAAAAQANSLANSLAMLASAQSHVYGSGPLVHCVVCAENYSNEHAFIRHSFLAHLLDPNINLNWFKVSLLSLNPFSQRHIF